MAIFTLLLFQVGEIFFDSRRLKPAKYRWPTKYFIGRVTLFFANNNLTGYQITMEFLHIFLDPDVIFSSHTIFINASTKEFNLVNNAIPSYYIIFEHLLYYSLAPPIL